MSDCRYCYLGKKHVHKYAIFEEGKCCHPEKDDECNGEWIHGYFQTNSCKFYEEKDEGPLVHIVRTVEPIDEAATVWGVFERMAAVLQILTR